MTINVASLASAISRTNAAMATLEQELNAADAKIGDGDTGGMLARLVRSMADQDISNAEDLGTAVVQLARAAMMATGSSLGTLLAAGMLAAGRAAKDNPDMSVARIAELMAVARDTMMSRGGASLGDKTVLDSFDAMQKALIGLEDIDAARQAIPAAADAALTNFRDKPNRIGRARMFGDKSIGIDDPGMLACARLSHVIAGPDT